MAEDLAKHQGEMARIDTENSQFAIEAANTVLSRPKAFRQALETGDWSAFPDVTPDMRSRSAFIDTGRKLLGQNEAREMAQSDAFLTALNESSDPDETRREYLKAQLDGADPLFSASLQAEFYSQTDRTVAARKTVIQFEAAELVRDRAMVSLANNLESINGPEDLTPYIGAVRRSMVTLGPKAMLEAENSAYKDLLRRAYVDGDQRALRLVKMRDPDLHDGLSVEDRFPDETEQFAREGVSSFGATETREQAEAIGSIRNMAAEGNLVGAMGALRQFEDKYSGSYNREIVGLKGQLISALGAQVDLTDAVNQALSGQNTMDISDSRKVDAQIFRRLFSAAQDRGMSPVQTTAAVSSWLRNTEPSTDLKGVLGSTLKGSDPNARAQMLQIYRGIPQAQRAGKFLDADQNLANYLLDAVETGQDPEAAYQTTLEHGLPDVSRAQVLSRNFGWTPKEEAGNLAKATTAAVEHGGKNGLYNTPFFGVSEDDIDPRLQQFSNNAYRDLARQFPSLPQDRIESMHRKKVAARAAMIMVNGEYKWTLTDDVLISATGLRWKAPDEDYLEDGRAFLEDSFDPPTAAGTRTRGSFVGRGTGNPDMRVVDLLIDEDSYQNYGLLPQFETQSGTVAPFGAGVGDVIWVTPQERASDLYKDFPEFGENTPDAPPGLEGRVPLRVVGGDRLVGERMMWRYNPETDTVMLRYIGPDLSNPTEAARLDAAHVTGTGSLGPTQADRQASRGRRARLFGQEQQNLSDPEATPSARDIVKNAPTHSPEETMSNLNEATRQDRTSGTFLLDYGSPEGQRFYRETYNPFLAEQEGIRHFAYDDVTGRRVLPGQPVKGDRTTAIGFNLDKFPNARAVLAQAGLTAKQVKDLYEGKYQLTQQQVDDISAVVSTKTARAVWDRYKDVAAELAPRQWAALMSLYHHGVTNTPKMTEALKSHDWKAVAQEVLFRSEGGIRPEHLSAVRGRRVREAMWLLGGRASEPEIAELLKRAKARLHKSTALQGIY
jgi:hypothetical protein